MSSKYISTPDLINGVKPVVDEFINQTDYSVISADSRELVDAGSRQALYVPAVRFLVDATLSTLTQPSAEEILPREINTRMRAATNLAVRIAEMGVMANLFLQAYSENEFLGELKMSAGEMFSLLDEVYLGGLGASPFFDACVMAGGAHRILSRSEIDEPVSDIIVRSKGLLAITGVHKGNSNKAFSFLGKPYAHMHHFVRKSGDAGLELTLSDTVKRKLGKLHHDGGGCPAAKLASSVNLGETVLEEYWGKIINYLVPVDATSDWKAK